jgi:hypothetical protein
MEARPNLRPRSDPSRGTTASRHPEAVPTWEVGFAELVVACGGLLAIGCWLILADWFSLREHFATPSFAFDKIPGHFSSWIIRGSLLLFLALTGIYAFQCWLLRRTRVFSWRLKVALVGATIGAGVANILIYPVAAIDIFYYFAQFKVAFHYHQNPYLLSFLPTFADDPLAGFGWPLHVPSAYGPAWLLIAGLPTALAGFDDLLQLLLVYKTLSLILVLLCGWVIAMYHGDERSKWLGMFLFVANPLVLFESVANAHNDILMTFFLLAAVLAVRRRSWLVLPLLALSALIKVFSLILVPIFVLAMVRARWSMETVLHSIVGAIVVTCAALAPFWAGGQMIGGMLEGMAFAEGLRTASPASMISAFLQEQQASPSTLLAVRIALGSVFLLSSALLVWKSRDFERMLVYVLMIFFMLLGALNPWYLIPLIALLALRPDRQALAYVVVATALGLVIYQVDIWARFESGLPLMRRHLLGLFFLPLPMIGLLLHAGLSALRRIAHFRQDERRFPTVDGV